jgi:hypothetical protein
MFSGRDVRRLNARERYLREPSDENIFGGRDVR